MDPARRNNPLMPPAKQQRILIWRSEVASALSPSDAPSLASSHTSTSVSTVTTTADDDLAAAGAAAVETRPSRSLWKRLSARFRSRTPEPARPAEGTAMYHNDGFAQQQHPSPEEEEEEEIDAVVAGQSSDSRGRGLKDKQDRLLRAARLLNGGSRRDDDAAV